MTENKDTSPAGMMSIAAYVSAVEFGNDFAVI
jgi:hypothetical protein